MIAPRWRKALSDIGEAPFRAALAVVAMAAGAFGLGMILTSYSVLTRELAATYTETRPASAILVLDRVDDPLVESARLFPGVGDAEARPVIRGRIRVGQDEWAPLVLFVVRDFDDLRIDRIRSDSGSWPPAGDEILLERSSLSVARAGIGDSVTVRAADGAPRLVRVAGTVHAPGLAPGWMDHVVSGFVTWDAAVRADVGAEAPAIRILVDGDRSDEKRIRDVADRLRGSLETQGRKVERIEVPRPGRHPHADQMDTFLFLLGAFGALALALSAVLVANMIHALLAEQVRQVGMMKAIGASTGQVAALYLGEVSILAAVSLCIGVPAGLAAGRAYARFAGSILNADIADAGAPVWVVAVLAAVGILVPLLIALGPVRRASRITIHEAFSGDVGHPSFGARRLDMWLARIKGLPRPLILSLRVSFHRRGRLLLTAGTLAAGGAAFISALNVSRAWDNILAQDADAQRYDIDVRLSEIQPIARVAGAIETLPDVQRAEYWSEARAHLVDPGGAARTRVNLLGPDADTRLLDPIILQGRWLMAGDEAAVVVNQGLLASDARLRVGGDIVLRVNDSDVTWPIVGVVKELTPMPTAYAPPRAVAAAASQAAGITGGIRIVTRRHDEPAQLSAQKEIERALEREGIGVRDIQRLTDRRQAFADHLVIIKSALLLAAGLVVLVGGLGLTSSLMLNVVERTREFGILSAIGATPRAISRSIVYEGLLIGVMSWCLAILVAVPVTAVLDVVAGRMFHKVALQFVMSPRAVATWLALVLVLATLSSLYPAWRASRLTVREALSYE